MTISRIFAPSGEDDVKDVGYIVWNDVGHWTYSTEDKGIIEILEQAKEWTTVMARAGGERQGEAFVDYVKEIKLGEEGYMEALFKKIARESSGRISLIHEIA